MVQFAHAAGLPIWSRLTWGICQRQSPGSVNIFSSIRAPLVAPILPSVPMVWPTTHLAILEFFGAFDSPVSTTVAALQYCSGLSHWYSGGEGHAELSICSPRDHRWPLVQNRSSHRGISVGRLGCGRRLSLYLRSLLLGSLAKRYKTQSTPNDKECQLQTRYGRRWRW
jgi:hypothetical protein